MLQLHGVCYAHPNKEQLFTDLNLAIARHDKLALVGNNGAGKSTLLQIMAGLLPPQKGFLLANSAPYYVPQQLQQYQRQTVAQALRVHNKLAALYAILAGYVTVGHMNTLADDWGIEERCHEALAQWGLNATALDTPLHQLSGGQQTKVLLAGIGLHKPEIVLLDEPSNHLDANSRQLLYNYIATTRDTLLVVSHDRILLNLLPTVAELSGNGITTYGGNYDFYEQQKTIEREAQHARLKDAEKALRKAKDTAREAIERQQKLDARGRKKQENAGLPTIAFNTLRNSAENSTAKLKDVHAGKVGGISDELARLRDAMPDKDRMKLGFSMPNLHKGKILIDAKSINFGYGGNMLWKEPLYLLITSGDRIAIKGNNGSGKTTLVRLLLKQLQPQQGNIFHAGARTVYIDQHYSLIDDSHTVYQQAHAYNTVALQEAELKSRLTHFLFNKAAWDKPCSALSGGERMRLMLCCLSVGNAAPDIIVMDEPTNNLDMQNVEILIAAISDYAGTLIVISHDAHFLQAVGVEHFIELD